MTASKHLRPGLFAFATSELSQDAFLAWLLSWADPAHREADSALHGIAREFATALLQRAGVGPPSDGFTVRVAQQVKGADVVAEIGEDHLLIIEDKVYASEHSDQLQRYRDALSEDYSGREFACVYLKTGDQSDYSEVERAGWAVFRRKDLLDVLRAGRDTVTHDVFIDFLAHIESIDHASERFRTVPPSEWVRCDDAYPGLYCALQEHVSDAGWHLVPNKRQPFYGFYWGWRDIEGGHIYLLLEEHRLVVKIGVEDESRQKEVRDRWVDRIDAELEGFCRPETRLGVGRDMTVGWAAQDYRVAGCDGLLDLDLTFAGLRKATLDLEQLAST